MLDCGENPESGVTIHYYIKDKPEGNVSLAFLDNNDNEIRTFSSKETGTEGSTTKTGDLKHKEPVVRTESGMNRFIWDTRYPGAVKPDTDEVADNGYDGPIAPPGTYKARLEIDGASHTKTFEILKDPRIEASQEDLQDQFDLLIKIRDKVSETYEAANRITDIRDQVDSWTSRATSDSAKDAVSSAANELKEKLTSVENEIVQRKTLGGVDRLSEPSKLDAKIKEIAFVPSSADYRPTKQAYEVFDDLSARLDIQFKNLQDIIDNDLRKFVVILEELEVPAINTQMASQD